MSTFPVPDYLAENAARLEKMSKEFGATLPKEMAAAINLMGHPAAGVAALTALGFGLAGQAFGMWAGAVAGAVEVSQRLLAPLTLETSGPVRAGTALVGDRHQHRQAEAGAEGRGAGRARAEGRREAGAGRQARARQDPKAAAGRCEGRAHAEASAKARPAESGRQGEPAKQATAKAKPAGKVVAKAVPAKAVEAPSTKPVAAKPAAKIAATGLMPEDFHKPNAIERPAAPDDLKAISGVGPKLEKVLNDLGVWTYAQVAAWSSAEVAWVDDYLSFSGRIGRDKWIEQAAALAAASAKPAKG